MSAAAGWPYDWKLPPGGVRTAEVSAHRAGRFPEVVLGRQFASEQLDALPVGADHATGNVRLITNRQRSRARRRKSL